MSALAKLTLVEAKLFRRDIMAVFFGLLFPALLIVALGYAIPGFRDRPPGLGGLRVIDIYTPALIGLALATVALSILPAYVATHRQTGSLRRLATTPVPPSRLLTAQLLVNLAAAVLAVALAIAATVLIFGVPVPENPVGLLGAFLLAAASMFAVGLLVAAVAPTAQAASGIGMTVYFPMLFFSGVWVPRDAMPDTLRRISDFTPAGSGVQAVQDAWYGGWPQPLHLAVMAAYLVVAGLVAAKLFRWE